MFLKLNSRNRKVGASAVTYLPFRTCPSSCPFLNGGCYAQGVLDVLRVVHEIDAATTTMSMAALVRQEAREIAEAAELQKTTDLPLRLHVAGDVVDLESARLLAESCRIWREKGGGPVWTYTHRWQSIEAWAWRPAISAWASVDTAEQGRAAIENGYPPALVVPYFDDRRSWDEAGIHWIACPAQTKKLTCNRCRICWKSNKMRDARVGVAFEAHGGCVGKGKAIATTRVLRGEQLTLLFD